MSRIDQTTDTKYENVLPLASVTAASTNCSVIDAQGYSSIGFFIYSGTIAAGDFSLKIEGSKDGSTWEELTADSNVNSVNGEASLTAGDNNTCSKVIGARGIYRHLQAVLVGENSPNGEVGVIAVLGSPTFAPV